MLFYDLFRHDPNLQSLPADSTLFQEGDAGNVMYVLVAGHATIHGGDLLLEEIGPGDIVGELAVIDSSPRTASVVANTDCLLAVIDQSRFRFLVQKNPDFALDVMGVMARRLRQCDLRLRAQITPEATA